MNKQRFILDIGFFMLVLVILILLANFTNAYTVYDYRIEENVTLERWADLANYSTNFKRENDFQTVYNLERFVENNLNYEFYWRSRNLKSFWKDHKGDCTEKANSIVYLLDKNGVRARAVHGYTWLNGQFALHDWYEYNINRTWYSHEWIDYDRIKKKGDGIW